MRPRRVAVTSATLLVVAGLSPAVAAADGQNTLYVSNASSACSDSGPGTQSTPYCSIQAAADAANPGDVVFITPSSSPYGPVTMTRSGTATAPILFAGTNSPTIAATAAQPAFTLSGASDVELRGLNLPVGSGQTVVIDGGSGDTLSNDTLSGNVVAGALGVHVTGGASAVTVQDSNIADGVTIDGGAAGTILTTNSIQGATMSPVSVASASNTAITSNTIQYCGPSVSVTGSSSTSIENNVIYSSTPDSICSAATQGYGVAVDAGSAGSTKLDYNDVFQGASTGAYVGPYSWSGTGYATAAALYAATSQGQHDYNGADGGGDVEGSPIINSADSGAIGEQPTDINGKLRTLDPLVKPTGAGPYNDYDRGAIQFQDPYTASAKTFTTSAAQVPVGASVNLSASFGTDTWSDQVTGYEYMATPGVILATSSSGNATVSFPMARYTVIEAYALIAGEAAPAPIGRVYVNVVPPEPLSAKIQASQGDERAISVSDAGSTDAWAITSATYDFGDGTPAVTVKAGQPATHVYSTAGTYTITETLTDADGATATTSTPFTTYALPTGDAYFFNDFYGAQEGYLPAGSTGIAHVALTGTPADTVQALAVTTGGALESNTCGESGGCDGWQTIAQPGVTVSGASIADMPNGTSQAIEVTSSGDLLHNVRSANGTWQPQGWGNPGGSGFVQASVTAMPDGSSQLVAVTKSGQLEHDIRFANGSWQGWRPLTQAGVTVTDAGIAGMADGSSQIIEVTSTGELLHDIRNANGSWQPQGWGSPGGGDVSQASITATTGGAIVTAVSGGQPEASYRMQNGAWNGWSGFMTSRVGSASEMSVAGLSDGTDEYVAVTAG